MEKNRRRSPCGNVDWNRTDIELKSFNIVVPLAGTWIEIEEAGREKDLQSGRSPCGNVDWNNRKECEIYVFFCRSPCGNVDWNCLMRLASTISFCRSPCGNVDWNSINLKSPTVVLPSFPLRERGLKLIASLAAFHLTLSFPLWERGLKQIRNLHLLPFLLLSFPWENEDLNDSAISTCHRPSCHFLYRYGTVNWNELEHRRSPALSEWFI